MRNQDNCQYYSITFPLPSWEDERRRECRVEGGLAALGSVERGREGEEHWRSTRWALHATHVSSLLTRRRI